MNGTWKVTGASGAGAVLALAAAAAAVEGVIWVAAHIWWILGTAALSAALTSAAVMRLARWNDEHDARAWARRPAQLYAEPVQQIPQAERPAIGPVYNFNFYGPAGDTHAAVIRKAITGTAGDAATKEE